MFKKISCRLFPSLLLLSTIILLHTGCVCEPASKIMTPTYLELDFGYLGPCNLYNGNVAVAEIEVNIDGLDADRQAFMMGTQFFDVNNDDREPSNLAFPIEIPTEGTFAVSVNIRLECHTCCYDECPLDEYAKPRFRGTSMTLNAVPPPAVIRVTPVFQGCRCNCN